MQLRERERLLWTRLYVDAALLPLREDDCEVLVQTTVQQLAELPVSDLYGARARLKRQRPRERIRFRRSDVTSTPDGDSLKVAPPPDPRTRSARRPLEKLEHTDFFRRWRLCTFGKNKMRPSKRPVPRIAAHKVLFHIAEEAD